MGKSKLIFRLLCLVFISALFTGCAAFGITKPGGAGKAVPVGVGQGSLVADVTYPCFLNSNTEFRINSSDFKILKTITAEATSYSILGLFSSGDSGYGELFKKAYSIGADDVINIKVDSRLKSFIGVFYKEATTKISGVAIKYNK